METLSLVQFSSLKGGSPGKQGRDHRFSAGKYLKSKFGEAQLAGVKISPSVSLSLYMSVSFTKHKF